MVGASELRDYRRARAGRHVSMPFLSSRSPRAKSGSAIRRSRSWMRKWESTNPTAASSIRNGRSRLISMWRRRPGRRCVWSGCERHWEQPRGLRHSPGRWNERRQPGARLIVRAWFKEALEGIGISIRVQRNVQAWFEPATDAYAAPHFPPFLLDRKGLPAPLYGFPDFGDGVKAAFHSYGDLTDAAELVGRWSRRGTSDRSSSDGTMDARRHAGLRATKPCLYTLTPDGHFVVDRHPEHSRLVLCGGFSGHGFKFAPVIGEIGADLALEECSRHKIDFLSLRRFARN